MPEPVSSSPKFSPRLLIFTASAAAYGLFLLVGRPLLPVAVRADRTAGLLLAIVVGAASASLLKQERHAAWWGFGLTLAVLAVYTGLMRLMH
jgi:hypothetical protein